MAMDERAGSLSRRDVVTEAERRGDGADGLRALADPAHRDVAIIQQTAQDTLIDVDTLDLVETHFKGAALDKAGLVDNPQIGDVGLGGPAMEPGGQHLVERE